MSGMFKIPPTMIIPSTTYATARPSVYETPDINAERGLSKRQEMKERAVTFVASGHGDIEVRMPSHKA